MRNPMRYRWVVDQEFPEGHLVEMSAADAAAFDAEQAGWAADAAEEQARNSNAAAMRAQLTARISDALTFADALDANTATPAQQRQALALCLRGQVRLVRLYLSLLEEAA